MLPWLQELLFGCLSVETGQNALSVVQNVIGNLFNPYLEAFDFNSKSCPNGQQLKSAFKVQLTGMEEALFELVHLRVF